MRRSRLWPLVGIVVVAFGSLVGTFLAGNSPSLGLDLQGGASVVLQPPPGTPADTLDQAIEVIRNRVDALGVAEPDITRQGNAVVVELPGVKDQQRAVELVGDTAELRFRPVLAVEPVGATTTTTTTSTTSTTVAGGDTTTTTAPTTTTTALPTTSREDNLADAQVVLEELDDDGEVVARYVLGPTNVLGRVVESARAQFDLSEWTVSLTLTSEGIEAFNALAAQCNAGQDTCLTGQLAIEIDGVVVSAPSVSQASYERDQIQISGSFSESEAKDLALVLRYGSLPVQLEQESVRTVSASLGSDSLRAGIVAGAIGTTLVLIYMVLYYRALGLVVVAGLGVWSALQWSIISYLGETQGLALSLSGVTGIIVSVGVTVDSYVVYFERLKDELRRGRALRSSVERSFKRAFRTILIADTSALIGAATLYLLTVGAVRGFAFYLGLSTVLDIVITWFFTRPLVGALARRRAFASSRFIRGPKEPGVAVAGANP
ncbi:MAG: protein translocase subunit SecD [Acidimicrobiia bacterium]